MKVVFMGSAHLACKALDALLAWRDCELQAVITQPDKPKGRHLAISPCPVKAHVAERGVPVLTPANVNSPESLDTLKSMAPDVIIVVAYGQFLRLPLITLPRWGCINLHASLLPKYRGAAPIQWAIANGEQVTGVTTIYLNTHMDAGDIIFQRAVPIAPDDTAGLLHDRLAETGAGVLIETLAAIRKGTAPRIPQDESGITFAHKLSRSDGYIDWTKPAGVICCRVRGFNPWPGCHAEIPLGSGKCVRILRALPLASVRGNAPGVILENKEELVIQAGEGAVRCLELQAEGGKAMSAAAFLRGHPLVKGESVG